MTRLRLFVRYSDRVLTPEESFERTRDLFARLARIHPLLTHVAPRAMRSGRANMMAQPFFPEISFEQWHAAYLARRAEDERHGRGPEIGVYFSYWNRIGGDERQLIEIRYNADDVLRGNEIFLTDLPAALVEPQVTLELTRACVEVFGGSRAETAWLTTGEDMTFLYHRLWLEDGVPFPEGKRRPQPGERIRAMPLNRYPFGHPPPPEARPWLGGTLYTWPQHDAMLLMHGED